MRSGGGRPDIHSTPGEHWGPADRGSRAVEGSLGKGGSLEGDIRTLEGDKRLPDRGLGPGGAFDPFYRGLGPVVGSVGPTFDRAEAPGRNTPVAAAAAIAILQIYRCPCSPSPCPSRSCFESSLTHPQQSQYGSVHY